MKTIKEIVEQAIEAAKQDGNVRYLDDLLTHGRQSGMVNDLIYYSDTCKFYEDHQLEISDLLIEFIESTDASVGNLFGDKWDNSDPLARGAQNQNLLAWFGYEETARRIQEGE